MREKLAETKEKYFGEQVPTKRKFFHFICVGAPIFSFMATMANVISGTVRGDNSPTGFWACLLCTVICFAIYPISKHFKNFDLFICLMALGLNMLVFPLLYFTVGGIDSSMSIFFVIGIVFAALLMDNRKTAFAVVITSFIWYAVIMFIDYKYFISERFSVLDRRMEFVDTFLDFLIVSSCIAVLVKILAESFERQQNKTDKLLVQMEDLSVKDPLTGAYNRRFLIRYLDSSMKSAADDGKNIAIVMFDIDKFKRINDDYGHLVGDEVIKALSNVLMSSCRDYDIVSRYGGEEFLLVLPGATEEIAYNRANQIREKFGSMKISSEIDRPVTISGGVAELTSLMKTPDDFIKIADDNLYKSKETGRNRIISQNFNSAE